MSFAIRSAVPGDAAALAEMIVAISAEYHEPHYPITAAEVLRDGFGSDPAFRALVADWLGREAVGYALFYPMYWTELATRGLFLHDLYTRPAFRSRGIGKAMIAAVAAEAKASGREFVYWLSDEADARVRRLYDRVGAYGAKVRGHFLHGGALDLLAGLHGAEGRL